jgi:transposase
MSIVGGLDIHRKQLTFDWVDDQSGKWEYGRIAPANRRHLAGWLPRFDPAVAGPVEFAMEGCAGWRYIAEEMAKSGVSRTWPIRPTRPRCVARSGGP